jgi:hypothetical protein
VFSFSVNPALMQRKSLQKKQQKMKDGKKESTKGRRRKLDVKNEQEVLGRPNRQHPFDKTRTA